MTSFGTISYIHEEFKSSEYYSLNGWDHNEILLKKIVLKPFMTFDIQVIITVEWDVSTVNFCYGPL